MLIEYMTALEALDTSDPIYRATFADLGGYAVVQVLYRQTDGTVVLHSYSDESKIDFNHFVEVLDPENFIDYFVNSEVTPTLM